MRRVVCVITAVLLTVACGDAARNGEVVVATVIDTVRGVVHIQNSGSAPEWTVERVLRLGTVEGGPQEFGRIRSVIADVNGTVTLPPRAVGIPPYVRSNHFYQVETGEMGVQHVGVYRISSTD
jgi:hypothetical protein